MLTGFSLGKNLGKVAFNLSYKDRNEIDHYNVDWKIKGETRINYRNHVPVSEICYFLSDMFNREDVEMISISYHGSGEKDGSNCWIKSDITIMMF